MANPNETRYQCNTCKRPVGDCECPFDPSQWLLRMLMCEDDYPGFEHVRQASEAGEATHGES